MKKIAKLLLVMLCLLVFISCGGGSGGTDGGETVRISGRILSDRGDPVPAVNVTDLSSGRVVKSAVDGSFTLESTESENSVTLQFSRQDKQTVLEVSTLEKQGDSITLTFVLNISDFSVSVLEESESASPSPTPTPKEPGLSPTDSPHPTALSVISGTVRDANAAALPGVVVRLNDSKKLQDETGANGKFHIEFESKSSQLMITVERDGQSASTTLNDLPAGRLTITVNLVISTATTGPTPAPTSGPAGTPTPTPSPDSRLAVSVESVQVTKGK